MVVIVVVVLVVLVVVVVVGLLYHSDTRRFRIGNWIDRIDLVLVVVVSLATPTTTTTTTTTTQIIIIIVAQNRRGGVCETFKGGRRCRNIKYDCLDASRLTWMMGGTVAAAAAA